MEPSPVERLRAISINVNFDDEDDEVIAAPVTVAPDGGWGWVVVAAAFQNYCVLDGTVFTFISILDDMAHSFDKDPTTVATISSIILGMLYLTGPFVSAFLNRYGFRMTTMLGSVLCATSVFFSSFVNNFLIVLVLYGFCHGLGCGFINMCANVVVGFYFEKKRPLATALASSGSNMGIMVFSLVYSYFSNQSGWRNTLLLQSGMYGIVFFAGMAFRPLLSITVTVPQVGLGPMTRLKSSPYVMSEFDFNEKKRQSVYSTASNMTYRPIADVIREEMEAAPKDDEGTSARPRLKSILKNVEPSNSVPYYTPAQSVAVLADRAPDTLAFTVNNIPDEEKKGCCANFFTWKSHVKESRPMYRDDAFYQGDIKHLHAYKKSMLVPKSERTGLEYSLAVSRVTLAKDMKENHGLCTTSFLRTLATIANPALLKLPSFIILLSGTFSVFLGYIVPFIFAVERSKLEKVDASHYNLYVSVLGLAGLCGKISLGTLSGKVPAIRLYSLCSYIAGILSIVSVYTPQYYFQYAYLFIFGVCSAGVIVTRSLLLVDLYRLENLTNATGLVLFITGTATFASTPIAGMLMNKFGVNYSFYFCGASFILGGILTSIVPCLRRREIRKELNKGRKISEITDETLKNTLANIQGKLPPLSPAPSKMPSETKPPNTLPS